MYSLWITVKIYIRTNTLLRETTILFHLRKFFFVGGIIALPGCAGSCCTTRRSAKGILCPLLELPSQPQLIPALSSSQPSTWIYRALGCTPCVRQQLPSSYLLHVGKAVIQRSFLNPSTRSSPAGHQVLFPISAALFLPCK